MDVEDTLVSLVGQYRTHGLDSATFDALLREAAAAPGNGGEQLLAQMGDKAIVAVGFQRQDGALIGEPFRLAAPIVFRRVTKGGIAGRNAGQREGRPEFRGIEQVLFYKAIRHALRYAAPVHAAQGVVAQDIDRFAVFVPVVQRSALFIP